MIDWNEWARAFEHLDGVEDFVALFADGGVFCDPVTPWTTDVRRVAVQTEQIFPDWNATVDSIRGGSDWAVFEWTGRGTLQLAETPTPVVVHGATVVEVDQHGKVTRWRDYLDTNEPMQQVNAAQGQGASPQTG